MWSALIDNIRIRSLSIGLVVVEICPLSYFHHRTSCVKTRVHDDAGMPNFDSFFSTKVKSPQQANSEKPVFLKFEMEFCTFEQVVRFAVTRRIQK